MKPRNYALGIIAFTCGLASACGALYVFDPPLRVVATDGTAWNDVPRETQRDAETRAIMLSAAHDGPCPEAQVKLLDSIDGDSTRAFVTEGCGMRLTYNESCAHIELAASDTLECKFFLIGSVDLKRHAQASTQ